MRPFLKWAGGKYRLLTHLIPLIKTECRFIEPFVGSGAVLINQNSKHEIANDKNFRLIECYKNIQEFGVEFINSAEKLFKENNNTQDVFLNFRKEFNMTNDSLRRSALMIYLNRHCFNGLTRYNSKGEFNVPFGKYKNPAFPKSELLNFHHKTKTTQFTHLDFREVFIEAKEGDCIYCDPPYLPLSDTSNFTGYLGDGFTLQDQIDLAICAEKAVENGITVVISNHDTNEARNLYKNAQLIEVNVPRMISAKASSRLLTKEIIAVYSTNSLTLSKAA